MTIVPLSTQTGPQAGTAPAGLRYCDKARLGWVSSVRLVSSG